MVEPERALGKCFSPAKAFVRVRKIECEVERMAIFAPDTAQMIRVCTGS